MKYIIVIVLIILLLVFLLSKPKKKNRNKNRRTDSNIIISSVNPDTCYDTKQECDSECRGYRCSENCLPSNTQCLEGETNCYGSEEDCKSSCVAVYRCNSFSGPVTDYKPCLTGESGCYSSQSDATRNCVKTYSCAGIGPTGATGCITSNFGPPCASGATNCYNSLTSCTDSCKGYRCSNCATAGAKCDTNEPNCYNTSASCSTGPSSCPNVYRCNDNCLSSRIPCTPAEINEGQCHSLEQQCKTLCRVSYRCTPDKKCNSGYTPCLPGETTCFKDSNTCRFSLDSNCQKGYRCSAKCAPERMCDIGEYNCYDTQQLCINNCKGYRCGVNCAEGQGCTPTDSNCYVSPDKCKTECTAYRCTGLACVQQTTKCTVPELDNKKCFTINNCSNECSKTVFDRINNNEDIKYKILNVQTGRVLKAANYNPSHVQSDFNNPSPLHPDQQYWRFQCTNGDGRCYMVNNQNNTLICPNNESDGHCYDDNYQITSIRGNENHKINIVPSDNPTERSVGMGYLNSLHNPGWISLGHAGGGWGTDGSENDPRNIKVQWNKADRFAKWQIIPYSNAGVRLDK